MLLTSLWIQHFRNHIEMILEVDNALTVIIGPNGSGKTNILEAIYLLATGKSFRAEKTEHMIHWQAELGRVKARVEHPVELNISTTEEKDKQINFTDPLELEATLTRGMLQSQRTAPKLFTINGIRRLQHNFVGQLRAVLFGPWDMRLIDGSPTRRRTFLDDILSQVFSEYRQALLSYEKGLRRRNKVLQAIKEGISNRSQLFFWDKLLIKEGNIITDHRRELVDYLNHEPRIMNYENKQSAFQVSYDPSIISEQRLANYAREEVAATATLVGPHRDDFQVGFIPTSVTHLSSAGLKIPSQEGNIPQPETKNMPAQADQKLETVSLATYGSRGQQRMAILWLKLGELAFIEHQTGEKPLLLLDDIFSELDHEHRHHVMNMITNCQTIITAADEHLLENIKGKVIHL